MQHQRRTLRCPSCCAAAVWACPAADGALRLETPRCTTPPRPLWSRRWPVGAWHAFTTWLMRPPARRCSTPLWPRYLVGGWAGRWGRGERLPGPPQYTQHYYTPCRFALEAAGGHEQRRLHIHPSPQTQTQTQNTPEHPNAFLNNHLQVPPRSGGPLSSATIPSSSRRASLALHREAAG